MVFSSAIFLFVFFPATFLIYHIVPRLKMKNVLLIIASLIFYSFGQPKYLLLLFLSVAINYVGGLLIQKISFAHKGILCITILLNIALLAIFKYADFAVENMNRFFYTAYGMTGIVLPIGISFYTFQGMSYVIDVYRDPEIGTKNPLKLLLYISFFPQLVAGPIIKYHDIAEMIDDRCTTWMDTARGLRRFIIGLSKKLLISNVVGAMADQIFSLDVGGLDLKLAWLGAICYTLQIYFDFSGYSDMAIGMGRVFGFRYLENFSYPYISKSVQEFWRRWHISLSSWFRDYLYIPLGGNRCSKWRCLRNKYIVFFSTGLWHGANWTFIFWGLWHGTFLILEDVGVIPRKRIQGRMLGSIYTMLVVIIGFTFFRANSMAQGMDFVHKMFTGFSSTTENVQLFHEILTCSNKMILLLAFVLSIDIFGGIKKLYKIKEAVCNRYEVLSFIGVGFLFLYDILNLSQATFNPFIYFQF